MSIKYCEAADFVTRKLLLLRVNTERAVVSWQHNSPNQTFKCSSRRCNVSESSPNGPGCFTGDSLTLQHFGDIDFGPKIGF